jgi:hypothetical protein
MANDLFRKMVSIAREYIHPFLVESLINKLCEKCGTTENEVTPDHLPSILLAIATENELFEKLKFHEYLDMMKKFMDFSNSIEQKIPEKICDIPRKHKNNIKKLNI